MNHKELFGIFASGTKRTHAEVSSAEDPVPTKQKPDIPSPSSGQSSPEPKASEEIKEQPEFQVVTQATPGCQRECVFQPGFQRKSTMMA